MLQTFQASIYQLYPNPIDYNWLLGAQLEKLARTQKHFYFVQITENIPTIMENIAFELQHLLRKLHTQEKDFETRVRVVSELSFVSCSSSSIRKQLSKLAK